MGRSTVHPPAALLDAAIDLFGAGGPRAVTMVAVARAVGAPSGSVYHRFPDRGSLLAALWQRTAGEFEERYLDALGPSPTPESAVRAAVWIVEWCRHEPGRAAVLNAGPRAFEPETWSDAARDAHQAAERTRARHQAAAIRAVAHQIGVRRDETAFAMFGLPMAIVGHHLRVPEPIPPGAADLVRRLASGILTRRPA